MNPMKWAVWIRIAVFVSILWAVFVFADIYQDYQEVNAVILSRRGIGLLPIFLFWGGVWIAHGIRLRHKRKKATKEGRTE
jgi:hypothetical protein